MNIITRLQALLSRKFLAPILATFSFIIWKLYLSAIPIEIYATFVGALFGSFLLVEGIRDIIIAIQKILEQQK